MTVFSNIAQKFVFVPKVTTLGAVSGAFSSAGAWQGAVFGLSQACVTRVSSQAFDVLLTTLHPQATMSSKFIANWANFTFSVEVARQITQWLTDSDINRSTAFRLGTMNHVTNYALNLIENSTAAVKKLSKLYSVKIL